MGRMMPLMNSISSALENHRPRRIPGRHRMTRAGVAAVLLPGQVGLDVLLMQRATRPGDPWSGHMSFPGGRCNPGERSTLTTAIRETEEELDLSLSSANCIGRLSDVVTRKHEHWRPMIVTPWVFYLDKLPKLTTNREAVSTIQIPIAFLADHRHRKSIPWHLGPAKIKAPCYFYEGRKIWGLTLMMLDELIGLS